MRVEFPQNDPNAWVLGPFEVMVTVHQNRLVPGVDHMSDLSSALIGLWGVPEAVGDYRTQPADDALNKMVVSDSTRPASFTWLQV